MTELAVNELNIHEILKDSGLTLEQKSEIRNLILNSPRGFTSLQENPETILKRITDQFGEQVAEAIRIKLTKILC
jgi:hypothetical protein